MPILSAIKTLLHPAQLTPGRMAVALGSALVADGLQILLQAVPLASQGIDVIASVIVMAAIGFHLLLLPTFVIELVPFVNDFPTWTGCVIAVLALRKREAHVVSAEGSPVITAVASPEASKSRSASPPPP